MRIALYVTAIALVVLCVSVVYAQEGLVLYLSFDNVEGDKVKDESGNGNG